MGSRWSLWKEIFCKKAVVIIAAIYGLAAFLDLVKNEFLAQKYQEITLVRELPDWSWPTWVVGLLAILSAHYPGRSPRGY
jgi:hypothetical protein